MLTSDLLINTVKAGVIQPKHLETTGTNLELARTLIDLFRSFHGSTRGDLDEALLEDEGDNTDFRVRRGLAHLLYGDRCEFTTQSLFPPDTLRERAFALSTLERPTVADTPALLERLAHTLSLETGVTMTRDDLERGLYADLKEHQIITFNAPTAEWLLNRYNLAQSQGVLYRASEVTITAHRNDPGEYKLLFKYLKLFGLMHRINGDPDAGYTITLDGPLSLFKSTTMYGVRFAAFLPALLHATRWTLTATVHPRVYGEQRDATFTMDSSTKLQSHYPPGKVFDSILEHGFAERFAKLQTPWKLEREVDLVDLGGTVMIPDFRLVHEDGRAVLLEIIGFWKPEYLRRKFDKIAQSNRQDLVIAVSDRLNLGDAAQKNLERVSHQVVWFKGVLEPKRVIEVADRLEAKRVSRLD
jgi:uncharacterized protein